LPGNEWRRYSILGTTLNFETAISRLASTLAGQRLLEDWVLVFSQACKLLGFGQENKYVSDGHVLILEISFIPLLLDLQWYIDGFS
jgi:hypothetical protein